MKRLLAIGTAVLLTGPWLAAQGGRPASPAGSSATQVGGKYANPPGADEPVYQGGKWIEITYGRPIKRGRDLWGSGADYGKKLNAGAPVWRAGANVTTRLKSEVPLVINGKTVPAGEYSLFVDLKPNNWTLIVSNWAAQTRYDPNNKDALWGAYNYTPDKDVVRAPMTLSTLPFAVDQLTWNFVDMTETGGKVALVWDKNVATVPFKVGTTSTQ
jgi:hypothetical protein